MWGAITKLFTELAFIVNEAMLLNLAMEFGFWWDRIIKDKTTIENFARACWSKIHEVMNMRSIVGPYPLEELEDEEQEDSILGDYDTLEDSDIFTK